jgi:hypothetical protein
MKLFGKHRLLVFIGSTVIEFILAKLFGLGTMQSITLVLIGNFLVAQWADMVYKEKIKI